MEVGDKYYRTGYSGERITSTVTHIVTHEEKTYVIYVESGRYGGRGQLHIELEEAFTKQRDRSWVIIKRKYLRDKIASLDRESRAYRKSITKYEQSMATVREDEGETTDEDD